MKVAIIGGGIIGLMTAYYLAKEGTNVTVFDPSPGKFSIHAAGLIEPYRFDRINTSAMIYKMLKYMKRGVTEVRQLNRLWIRELLLNLNKSPPEEAWETMRAMAKFSLDAYAKFAEEKNDFDYANDGLLEIYSKKDDLEKGVEEEKRSPFSPKTEIMDVPGFAGGIYFPELSRIATEKFTRRIISEVENMKVKFQQKKVVPDLENSKIGNLKFDKIVLANGVWITSTLKLPVTSFKGYGLWVKGTTKLKGAFVTVDEGIAVSPLSDHVKVTGGFSADFTEEWKGDRILDKISSLLKVEDIIERNMGFRPCSPDGFPILGKKGNVVIATGACRLGWSYGPAMGYYASELALDKIESLGYLSRYVESLEY